VRKRVQKLSVLLLALLIIAGLIPASVSAATNPSVSYRTHVQNEGWQDWKKDGTMSGTSGKGFRLEGIEAKLDTQGYDLGINYQTHIQNIGWEADTERGWKSNGTMSGTEGLSYRLEAIQIKLTGSDADKFDVYYQVHAQNMGWLGWAKNGESAGTAGFGYRLEGINIVVVPAGSGTPDGVVDKAEPFYENQLAPYAQILQQYKYLDETNDYDKNLMPHVSTEFRWMTSPIYNHEVEIYYLLEDLSGDSIPELILIDSHEPSGSNYTIVDTYRLVNGVPERIFDTYSMANRIYYNICESQVIRVKSSGAATNTVFEYYRLDGNNQRLVFKVVHDSYQTPENYTVDSNNVIKTITPDEFKKYVKLEKYYEPFRTELNWIKL